MRKKLLLIILTVALAVCTLGLTACGGGVNNFKLSFIVDDEVYATIETTGNEIVTIPNNPTKDNYIFEGWYWDNDIWEKPFTANSLLDAPISSDMKVYAKFKINSFTVTWKNYDGTVLETDKNVPYGTMPSFDKSNPTKPATAQYTYTFSDWDKDISAVTGDVTYTAEYSSVVNKYTVTWKNYDGTVLETDTNVGYGTTPSYDSATPTQTATAQYTYTFSGWHKEISAVTGDATYIAEFNSFVNKYAVTWKNYDGTVLETDLDVSYGTTPSYGGETPEKVGDAQYSYTFSGWSPEVVAVTGDTVYTAQFTQTTNTYTVTWKNYDGTVLETDLDVVYGANPSYDGEQPTRSTDIYYAYTFNGWEPEKTAVSSDVVYVAKFTKIANEYSLTFKADGQTISTVKYTVENQTIVEPLIPDKTGYTSTWEEYELNFEDKIVNAIYSVISYTITYIDEREVVNNNPTGYTIESETITLLPLSDIGSGYSFDGWLCDGQPITEITKGSFGHKTLTAKWIEYALSDILYDTTKKAISVYDTLNAELFNATCKDTDGNNVLISVTAAVESLEGGQTIFLTLKAVGLNDIVKQEKIRDVRVYDAPILTFNDSDKDYINLSNLNGSWFNATATDSFEQSIPVTLSVESNKGAGELATIFLSAVDTVGNKTIKTIENIKLYGSPTITYNKEKTNLRIDEDINAELFSASSVDSFGEKLDVDVTLYQGNWSAGTQPILRLTSIDGKGNTAIINIRVRLYGIPSISTAKKTNFQLTEQIDSNTLGITAKDSFNNILNILIEKKSGEKLAGTQMIYTATVIDCVGNTYRKDFTIKIFDTPSIQIGRIDIKDNEQLSLNSFNVVAKDSFGNAITVNYGCISGQQLAGQSMVYQFTTVDAAGCTATINKEIFVYSADDIGLSYKKVESIKLASKGEEFKAFATDSFDNLCEINLLAAEGYSIVAGEVISLYIVATDKAGNMKKSDLLSNIKVYGSFTDVLANPTNGYTMQIGDDINSLIYVYDNFGEKLLTTAVANGNIEEGRIVNITISATDCVGNTFERSYDFAIHTFNQKFVELYVDGIYWKGEFVKENSISIPTSVGKKFCGYEDNNGMVVALSNGELVRNISNHTKLFALYDYTYIYSKSQLQNISLNGKYILMNNIDLGGLEWTPICGESAFNGVFNGNGYVISNYKITGSALSSYGFFGRNNGLIKNFGIVNFEINVSVGTILKAGGLVGINSGTIDSCFAKGNVTAISVEDSRYVRESTAGGLIGHNTGTINNCYATGDVYARSNDTTRAGGLVGSGGGIINNCYATGDVTAYFRYSNYRSYAGGLTGASGAKINNCFATGNTLANSYDSYTSSLNGSGSENLVNSYGVLEQTLSAETIYASDLKALSELCSVKFQTETLGWTIDNWIFTESTLPKLNWES